MSKLKLRVDISISKALYFGSRVVTANSFFPVSLTLLIVENISLIV